MDTPFAARSPYDITDLARGWPLAWLVARGADGPLAGAVPLLVHADADGRLQAIEGHLPRTSPLVAALRIDARALLLWMGPQGYVSPSWLADRTQAPTWNFASLQCEARIEFTDDAAALRAHLETLVAEHEAGRAAPWQPAEMGARYDRLAARIVAFRAVPLAVRERFKLGQDERDDVYADIVSGLRSSGADAALAAWMARFNPGRPDRDTT